MFRATPSFLAPFHDQAKHKNSTSHGKKGLEQLTRQGEYEPKGAKSVKKKGA
jgi:hypothetical protein